MAQVQYDSIKICQPANNLNWVRIYEESFPPEELWPADLLCADVASGKEVLHTTEDSAGRTLCFSLIAPLEQFIWLDFIAVDKEYQSSGIGSRHVSELLKICKLQYSSSKGIFFAIESIDQSGIDPLTATIRTKRQNFWLRLGAKHTRNRAKIFTPNSVNPEKPLIMELFWFEFSLHPAITSNDLRSIISKAYLELFEFKKEMVEWMLSQFNGE